MISLSSIIILKLAKYLGKSSKLSWQLIWLDIIKQPITSITFFTVLGISSLLLNFIPQVKSIIGSEIEVSESKHNPSFFLFDIQEEQVELIKDIYKKQLSEQNYHYKMSPLVRARLEKINRKSVAELRVESPRTREQQWRNRFVNRSYNLTYRNSLNDSETLLSGKLFSEIKDNTYPKISLEHRFAKRLGISLGDTLTFDIQNVEIEGKVVNLRRVKWSNFEPNFFVVFEEGLLSDAPKTYVSSLHNVPSKKKNQKLLRN